MNCWDLWEAALWLLFNANKGPRQPIRKREKPDYNIVLCLVRRGCRCLFCVRLQYDCCSAWTTGNRDWRGKISLTAEQGSMLSNISGSLCKWPFQLPADLLTTFIHHSYAHSSLRHLSSIWSLHLKFQLPLYSCMQMGDYISKYILDDHSAT